VRTPGCCAVQLLQNVGVDRTLNKAAKGVDAKDK
jgi:hypothetical protein